jgi:hypothetical protein
MLSVRVEQGSVVASLRAESPAAVDWIRAHDGDLRNALNAQGLRLEQMDVTVDPEGRRRHQRDAQEAPTPRRRRAADEPRFEVVV